MIQNPIFKGFNPDPCICRKDDDYYVAVSGVLYRWSTIMMRQTSIVLRL